MQYKFAKEEEAFRQELRTFLKEGAAAQVALRPHRDRRRRLGGRQGHAPQAGRPRLADYGLAQGVRRSGRLAHNPARLQRGDGLLPGPGQRTPSASACSGLR